MDSGVGQCCLLPNYHQHTLVADECQSDMNVVRDMNAVRVDAQ